MAKLTDRQVRNLTGPSDGKPYQIHYDGPAGVRGFGIRVTKGGAKSWILNYRARGIERRLTIGSFPDWSVVQARTEAMRLKRLVDQGFDPQAERAAQRGAPTVNQALDRYVAEYLPRLREGSQRQYLALIRQWLRPELGTRKLADIRHSDVEKLHRKITAGAPVRANRAMTLLSRVFALSIKWEMRLDNPARGLERNPEQPRERYLSGAEFGRLTEALAAFPDQRFSDAVRLLLLTGARKGEVFGMEWSQIDLDTATWVKPASFVKQEKLHRVPLSDAALAIVVRIKEAQEAAGVVSQYVFPWPTRSGHLVEIWRQWAAICKAAEITGLRLHDCRHSFASELVSAGFGLPVIGKLLGHSQISTTQRYSHLYDEPQRVAVERASARGIGGNDRGGGPAAEMVPLKEREETQKALAHALRDAAIGVAGARESLGLPPSKLTPALRKMLTFIAEGGTQGRMLLQVTASGGRASSQFQALKNASYVADAHAPVDQPDRVVATAAGRTALAPPRSTAMTNAFAGVGGNGATGPMPRSSRSAIAGADPSRQS